MRPGTKHTAESRALMSRLKKGELRTGGRVAQAIMTPQGPYNSVPEYTASTGFSQRHFYVNRYRKPNEFYFISKDTA
jgi:hypothetical protein